MPAPGSRGRGACRPARLCRVILLVLRARPGRFSGSARITTLSVFDHFSAPAQCANFCNTGDYSAIPCHAKLELFVWIMPIRVDGELDHDFSSCLPAACTLREPLAVAPTRSQPSKPVREGCRRAG